MVRVPGVALLLCLSACSLIFPNSKSNEPKPVPKGPPTRAEIEERLRGELDKQPGDLCAKAEWLRTATGRDGLEGEVAEELRAEVTYGCAAKSGKIKIAATTTPDEAPVEITFDAPCGRKDIEAKLRAANAKQVTNDLIEEWFARCFATKIKECQTALDADVDEGVACWRKGGWSEVPKAVDANDVGATTMCLGEMKAVVSDLRTCRTKKKPADVDACVAPYIGYVPKCPLLDPNRAWNAFPGHEDVERVANADAKRRGEREDKVAKEKAEREARIAKETERCFGRTTLDFAERLRTNPGPRSVPGCQYQVAGTVFGRNNVYVQLVDPSGSNIVLLRTRETFPEGAPIGDRVATFDTLEQAELQDGSKRAFPVFKLSAK
ncbi:MAG: hypothetical protein ABI867_19290 [Kofleriaceae bacterium]